MKIRIVVSAALMHVFLASTPCFASEKAVKSLEKRTNYLTWGLFATAFIGACIAVSVVRSHIKLRELRADYNNLQNLLRMLTSRIDSLPFDDFHRQAERKIAEMRSALEGDVNRHRRLLLEDIEALRAESNRLASELEQRQHYLKSVQNLVDGIRDKNNTAFVEDLARAKSVIELSLNELRNDRVTLSNQVAQLAAQMNEFERSVRAQKEIITVSAEENKRVKETILANQEQAAAAGKFVASTVAEVAAARNNIKQAQVEFAAINNQAKTLVSSMENLSSSARSEKESAEKQLQQVRALLDEVKGRVGQLRAVAVQEEQKVQDLQLSLASANRQLSDSVRTGSSLVQSSFRQSSNQSSYSSPVPSGGVVSQARAELCDAFGITSSATAEDYRRAYRKFLLKNHPDKGGNAAAFQAIDGLYQLLVYHNLFESQSCSESVAREIRFKLDEAKRFKSFLIR